jgi:hypothetical protein
VKTARRAARVAVTLAKLGVKLAPKWAAPVAGACLIFPGFVDELIVVPVIAVYVIVRNFRALALAARTAWAGGSR